MNFIERLEELIGEKHITKAQFLKECGFGGNSFSNWKNSKTGYPTEVYLTKIANYFDVSVEYLKGETDDRGQKTSPGQLTEAGEAKKNLLSAVAELSEDECKNVLALIDAAKKL